MQNLSPLEHLKIARRLHFQGNTREAINEYELVLELDPENEDAMSGLRALGVEPPDPVLARGATEHAGGLKTSFFVNQAKESHTPAWRRGPVKIIVCLLGAGMAFALYQFAILLLNFDNIKAMENVEVHFQKPTQKDDNATVSVVIGNYNPAPIKNMVISYNIADDKGNTLKDGSLTITTQVPAGDKRTFTEVSLGSVKGRASKLQPKLESLKYGPKPKKLKQQWIDKFIDASSQPDKDSFGDFCDLVDNTEDFAPAYVGLGRAYAARSDWKRAIENYKKAIEIDSDNANAHYYMAIAMFYQGDRTGAKKEMDTAASLAPDDPEITWNLKYLFNLKDTKQSKSGESPK